MNKVFIKGRCRLVEIGFFGESTVNQLWPNFFIAGAARSGTTSLHEYLSRIPGICMSSIKEPNFFLAEDPYPYVWARITDEKKYLSLFEPKEGDIAIGESSVRYLYDSGAAGKIYAKIPDAKILFILRDPIERAYSHYLYHIRHGHNTIFDFYEALKDDYHKRKQRMYIGFGMYSHQILRYFELFGRDRVKVIIFEDEFRPKTRETVQDIVYFLGLTTTIPDQVQTVFNSSSEQGSGSFQVPRSKAFPMISKAIRNVRGSNLFLINVIYPITTAISKNFLFKDKSKPCLTEEAYTFLMNIYRDDVEELCKVLRSTPSWATKYYNH